MSRQVEANCPAPEGSLYTDYFHATTVATTAFQRRHYPNPAPSRGVNKCEYCGRANDYDALGCTDCPGCGAPR